MNSKGIGEYGVLLANGKIKDYKTLKGAEKAYKDELETDYVCGNEIRLFEYTETVDLVNPIKSSYDNM